MIPPLRTRAGEPAQVLVHLCISDRPHSLTLVNTQRETVAVLTPNN